MSYRKLIGRITEVYGTRGAFADAIGMDRSSLSCKLNNKTPWKREEIEKTCELLHIPVEKVHEYFFAKEVGKAQL